MRLSRNDVRVAARTFVRHPGFTITAVLSLALAIALNTTMYGFLDALIRPKLDIANADRFYRLYVFRDIRIHADIAQIATLLRSRMQTYDALTSQALAMNPSTIAYDTDVDRTLVMRVMPNLFAVYGVPVVRGRGFRPEDLTAATPPIIISDRLADRFSPDGSFPVDTALYIDGIRRPVIGIVRGGALVPDGNHPDVFEPMEAVYPDIVRLRPGVPLAQAQAEFKQLAVQFALMTGDDPKMTVFDLRPLAESQFHFHLFHVALIAAVVALLLIACANLANLQLARGISRSRELALRTALGARRSDIIAQLLLESAVIAAAGLGIGLVLTFWGMHLLAARVPPSIADYVIEPQISWRLFAVAAVATVICVLVIGLIPAIRVSRADPNDLLKAGAGTGATGKHRRQYAVMVVAELGLSLALLSGAALVIRSAVVFHAPRMGFDPKPVAQSLMFLMTRDSSSVDVPGFIRGLSEQLRASPNISHVAVTYGQRAEQNAITINERGGTPHEYDAPMAPYLVTDAEYFRTLALPFLAGRNFPDAPPAQPEVIVDQRTARALWPGGNAVGQEIKLGAYASNAPWARVVGLVRDEFPNELMYNPSAQQTRIGKIYVSRPATESFPIAWRRAVTLWVYTRAAGDPARLTPTVQRLLPRGGVIYSSRTASLEDVYGLTTARQRHDFVASIFTTFAFLALGLSALGIYGIVAHSVAERRRELGVRLALGASGPDILRVVLREGNVVALTGIALGLLTTRFTAGWLDAFIIEDDQYNAVVFAVMAIVLFAAVVGAALRPALAATRIDPVESLRCE
jgi:putative ABC transport system permease protein